MEKVFDRLMKHHIAIVEPKTAQTFSRHKKIRYFRERGNIFIAPDRQYHKSIIHIPFNINIEKIGNKYFFKF